MKEEIKENIVVNEIQEEVLTKLQKELEENKKLAEERLTHLKYLQADFDNYRKKFDKEKEDIINLANEKLIKELLIIVDEFKIAIDKIENEKNRNGLSLVYKNFRKILENYGLKEINSLDKKFDPNYHEALMKEQSDKDGLVLEELQKGFILKTKVIRPSKVKVGENLKNK